VGTIHPSFFLLPLTPGEKLGVSIYEKRASKKRQGTLQIGNWKDDERLPEFIQYYGPATWAEDGSSGYCTPIYMLNPIIHLQVIIEMITVEDSKMAARGRKQKASLL
jgi:hypothetical protein